MSEARANILARLQRVDEAANVELQRQVEHYEWSREERIQRFTERMTAVRTEVHRVAKQAWAGKLLELAAAKGMGNLLYAPGTGHGKVLEEAIGTDAPELLPYADNIEDWKDRLFQQIDGAVTASRGAIAETGSLILWPDSHEPRLDAERIYSTFAEAMAEQEWAEDMPSNALLVSGPSKSADIEQTLAYGVHGPKELVVLVLL